MSGPEAVPAVSGSLEAGPQVPVETVVGSSTSRGGGREVGHPTETAPTRSRSLASGRGPPTGATSTAVESANLGHSGHLSLTFVTLNGSPSLSNLISVHRFFFCFFFSFFSTIVELPEFMWLPNSASHSFLCSPENVLEKCRVHIHHRVFLVPAEAHIPVRMCVAVKGQY